MQKNLANLRSRDIKFAFLFTLTQHNLDELPWVVNFCVESGANGLLIHPLEITGNAISQLSDKSPDAQENAHAWLLVEKLKQKYTGRLNIQLDVVHTSAVQQNPDQFFLGNYPTPLQGKLADLLSILVIEPDGEVVPLQYGFPREYSLGNLRESRISDMVERWQNHVGPKVCQLSADLHASLGKECTGRFVNWYEQLDQFARQEHTVSFPVNKLILKTASAGLA